MENISKQEHDHHILNNRKWPIVIFRFALQMEIIKKFIYDFLRLIDEYRKEKRRREFSDSEDDDDDPFHNKSGGFGFGASRRLNATPASSTIRADSVAGRSRAASVAGGPVNVAANVKGGAAAAGATPAPE